MHDDDDDADGADDDGGALCARGNDVCGDGEWAGNGLQWVMELPCKQTKANTAKRFARKSTDAL